VVQPGEIVAVRVTASTDRRNVFFALSKLLVFFTQPSNVLVLLGLVGLALTCTRFARAGWRLAVTSLVLIGLAGFLPLGKALSIPLENRPHGTIVMVMPSLQRAERLLRSGHGFRIDRGWRRVRP